MRARPPTSGSGVGAACTRRAGRARSRASREGGAVLVAQRVGSLRPGAASVWIALTIDGAYRWRSPSPRKRAKPGSGSDAGARRRRSAAAASAAQLALRRGPRSRRRPATRARPGSSARRRRGRAPGPRTARRRRRRRAVLMPIRASTLRRPGLERAQQVRRSRPRRVTSSAPRAPASSAASSTASHGHDAPAPDREGHRRGVDIEDVGARRRRCRSGPEGRHR